MNASMRPVMSDGSRPLQYAFLGLVAVVVVSPAFGRPPKDDYPLSTYPMFSTNKDPKTTVDQVVVVTGETATPLGPRFLGTDEVLQARATIARAVRGGKPVTIGLCTEVASRVTGDDRFADAAVVEVRTVTHDSIAYFAGGDTKPATVRTHARCKIPRAR